MFCNITNALLPIFQKVYDSYVSKGNFTSSYDGSNAALNQGVAIDVQGEILGASDEEMAEWCNPTVTPGPILQGWKFKTKVGTSTIRTEQYIYIPAGQDLSGSRPSQIAQHYWAEAGATVDIESSEPITYVASIIPGIVLAVKARQIAARKR